MILSLTQIQQIIKENPNRNLVSEGQKYNKKLRLHLYGDGLKDNLHRIEGYETPSLYELKVKYARSNRDLFSRLGRPIDKVFTAKGGSVYYNLGDSGDKVARTLALNVRNGYSVRKWVEAFWKPHMLDDPFGLLFLEILPTDEAKDAVKKGRSIVYPTYKPISYVYDYAPKGSELEYVVFKLDKQDKAANGIDTDWEVFRVVDDAFDYLVKKEGEDVIILPAYTLQNYFGYVPALFNSDINDPAHEDCLLSFFHDALELADHFLLKGAVKLTHEFLHAYPKYWQYTPDCKPCGGHGLLDGKECPHCKGHGKYILQNVSDMLALEIPTRDDVKIAPDVAGYVSPDKTYYEIATSDLSMLEELMNVTLWGAQSKIKTQGMSTAQDGSTETATEVMSDIKPEADRLHVISEMAEKRHKFILDGVVRLQVNQGYQGSSVSYGRRYMIEGPDEIWDKYSRARTSKNPMSVLDDLLIEFFEAKYQSDEVALAIALKLMYVEPFVHSSIQEVEILTSVGFDDKVSKTYFSEWLSLVSDAELLTNDVATLKAMLLEFAKAKGVKEPEPEKPKAF